MNIQQDSNQEPWNPGEIFERIGRWWEQQTDVPSTVRAGAGSKKKHERTRRAPLVTLFFDGNKRLTIAVLSRQLDSLSVYFQCRVEQGTAYQRSPLYYELEGFVRENLTWVRKQKGFDPASITVALGSMDASDQVQQEELELRRTTELSLRHAETNLSEGKLEEVLEIARLHRLNEDLDILSIYFMRQTSKAFGRVAARAARDKLAKTKLSLTPFVDGTSLAGYSSFVRGESSNLAHHFESGRSVEYRQCSEIELVGTYNQFKPKELAEFAWKCDELALANLHRWWGDIVTRDYVGQKVLLSWILDPHDVDSPHETTTSVPLVAFRLESCPLRGTRTWQLPHASMTLNVVNSHAVACDDVTMSYYGRVLVEKIELDFPCLVRAAARMQRISLCKAFATIIGTRPLLKSEEAYFQMVCDATSM